MEINSNQQILYYGFKNVILVCIQMQQEYLN